MFSELVFRASCQEGTTHHPDSDPSPLQTSLGWGRTHLTTPTLTPADGPWAGAGPTHHPDSDPSPLQTSLGWGRTHLTTPTLTPADGPWAGAGPTHHPDSDPRPLQTVSGLGQDSPHHLSVGEHKMSSPQRDVVSSASDLRDARLPSKTSMSMGSSLGRFPAENSLLSSLQILGRGHGPLAAGQLILEPEGFEPRHCNHKLFFYTTELLHTDILEALVLVTVDAGL